MQGWCLEEGKSLGRQMKRVPGAVVPPESGDMRMTSAQVRWSSHWD